MIKIIRWYIGLVLSGVGFFFIAIGSLIAIGPKNSSHFMEQLQEGLKPLLENETPRNP